MTPNQLQLEAAGVPIVSLQAIGTLHGVRISAVAAMNGPGAGLLSIDAAGLVTWSPPGGADGLPVDVSAGGEFVVFGDDPNQWLTISVEADYLALASQATVILQDVYNSPLVGSDVTATQSAAGNVQEWTITLHNTSAVSISDLNAWLAVDASDWQHWQISADNITWSVPSDAGHALSMPSIAASGTVPLYLRRTVVTGEPSQAELRLSVHLAWSGCETEARGLWRIFAPACYRFYCGRVVPPVEGSTPWDTATSLPHTPTSPFTETDGTWYLAMSYFNGVYDSGFLPLGPSGETYLTMSMTSGLVVSEPPTPMSVELAETTQGVVTVTALVASDATADEWLITYTVNGGSPITFAEPYPSGALAVLSASLPAQAAGSVVAVTVQTRRNDGTPGVFLWVVGDSLSDTITLALAGPTAPLDAISAQPIPE